MNRTDTNCYNVLGTGIMQKKSIKVDQCSVAHATSRAKQYVEDYEKKVHASSNDISKEARLKLSQCKSCFYFFGSRVGGAAITHQDCGICGKDMIFSNTCTDLICFACAEKNGLCNKCGGDVEMKERRKPYHFMEKQEL